MQANEITMNKEEMNIEETKLLNYIKEVFKYCVFISH